MTASYALSSDGSIWDWGFNGDGELGLGTNNQTYLTPQHLRPPPGYIFTAITANQEGAVAILTPVPEPASLTLFALGSIACRRPRRFKSQGETERDADAKRKGEKRKGTEP